MTSITVTPNWTGHPGLVLLCNLGHCGLCFSSNAPHTHTHKHTHAYTSCDQPTQMEPLLFLPDRLDDGKWGREWIDRGTWEYWNRSVTQYHCSTNSGLHLKTAMVVQNIWRMDWELTFGIMVEGKREGRCVERVCAYCSSCLKGTGNLLTARKE